MPRNVSPSPRTFAELTIQRPFEWFGWRKGPAGKQRARAFVIQGSAGFGKSPLVRRFGALTKQSGAGWALCSEQPANTDVALCVSTALYYLGRFAESAEAAKEGAKLQPGDPVLAAAAARGLKAVRDHEGAEEYRARAVTLLGAVSLYNQACVLSILGQAAEAVARLALAVGEDAKLAALARLDADFLDLRGTPAFEAALSSTVRQAAGAAASN